ncbi:MAG: transglutaminase-like domain-containing protein, partial [Gammaproteobacteria bacterium]
MNKRLVEGLLMLVFPYCTATCPGCRFTLTPRLSGRVSGWLVVALGLPLMLAHASASGQSGPGLVNAEPAPVTIEEAERYYEHEREARLWDSLALEETAPSARIALSAQAPSTPPPEITEMARALRQDVKLIFEYVRDEIGYDYGFGVQKGALGTMIDERGNAMDQSLLMVALLEAAGHEAEVVRGYAQLSHKEVRDWLDPSLFAPALARRLQRAGLVVDRSTPGTVEFSHAWVRVKVDGTWFVYDPTIRPRRRRARVDVLAVSGYDRDVFRNAALEGADVGTTSVRNVNRDAVRQALDTYAKALATYLRARPELRLEDVIGLPTHIEVETETRTTPAYPHRIEEAGKAAVQEFHTVLHLRLNGIDRKFNSSELYGHRLSIIFDASDRPVLELNGEVLATGSAAVGDSVTLNVDINHPYAAARCSTCLEGTFADQSFEQDVRVGGTYLVTNGWGHVGRGLVDRHQRVLSELLSNDGSDDEQARLVASLAVIGSNWMAQRSRIHELAGGVGDIQVIDQHSVGISGQDAAPYV